MPNPLRRRRLSGSPYPMLAAHFTAASTQYLTIADNASLSMGAGVRMSMAGWIWEDTAPVATRQIAGKGIMGGSAAQGEYMLSVTASNNLIARISNGTTLTSNSSALTPAVGGWSFVFCSYDGSNLNISLNNGAISAVAATLDVQDGANALSLGASATGSVPWDGRIDAWGIWKRALAAAEVTTLWANGVGLAFRDLSAALKASLVAWWDLDGSGADASGNGNSLGSVNGVTYVGGKR